MKNRNILRMTAAFLILFICGGCLFGCGKKKRVTKETEDTTYGIDVARYQGTIDWNEVAQSGIDFAMIRVGYRGQTDGIIKEDPNGRYNLQEASKAGIKIGAYFFSTAVSEEEAKEEAAWMGKILAKYPITYPVVYDCEGFRETSSRQYAMSKRERTDAALAFLAAIERLGYEGMFYASKGDMELDNHWETSRIEDKYKIWVAQYPAEPYPTTRVSSYAQTHHMWQYSTTGSVPGISLPVDLNIAYFGYDGIEPAQDKTPPKEAEADIEAMMDFSPVSEEVTAKNETNLRDIPSQGEDSHVMCTLKNGEIAQRIAISSSGWSKVVFKEQTYYAVSSYLTTDLSVKPVETEDDDGIQTQFSPVNESVTAKKLVNLRKLPSVEHEDAEVIAQLKHGDTATRIGISDNGWSKLNYQGETCYAVSSYLEPAGGSTAATPASEINDDKKASEPLSDGEIQTKFEPTQDRVTAKVEVNLRTLPSVEDPRCIVVATLKNGEVIMRTGINRDVGWSRVEYYGQILYCVSNYLTAAE